MNIPTIAIEHVRGREILDSRGRPTVEAEVLLADGSVGTASVPSGASTGAHEATELRDGDPNRFSGAGVLRSVRSIDEIIAPALTGGSAIDQAGVDRAMIKLDGTKNKSSLGANSILAVSWAVANATANYLGIPLFRYLGGANTQTLPVPMMTILNGGKHAAGSTDFQEFIIAPVGFERFSDALRAGVEVYDALKRRLASEGLSTNVGDEGGFAPAIGSNERALELIAAAIGDAGYDYGRQIVLALDLAATELYEDGAYRLPIEGKELDGRQMVDLLADWVERFKIVSIEDGMAEDDWAGWKLLTERLGDRVQLVGDDLLVTNTDRIQRAIKEGVANTLLVKPNQIGTVSETLAAVKLVERHGWAAMVSHRSGETNDASIAHLAVGAGVGQIKAGAPSRGERVAKYNELLRIEEDLGDSAIYPGWEAIRAARV